MSIPQIDLTQMCQTAAVAARIAGQKAVQELDSAQSSIKNGIEIVTQIDPLCQQMIIDAISKQYPDHGFLGEEGDEGKLLKIPPKSDNSIWWIIDPIDGTNNYANGLLCFCVSIGAMLDGKPVIGVVYDPIADVMYSAVDGGPALLNGSPIAVSTDPIGRFSSFGVDSHRNPAFDAGIESIMWQTRFRCLGTTALHMAYVAKGAMIGMATVRPKLWDICAGSVLIRQAGGIVSQPDGRPLFPVFPDKYQGETMPVLAASDTVYQDAVKYFIEN